MKRLGKVGRKVKSWKKKEEFEQKLEEFEKKS